MTTRRLLCHPTRPFSFLTAGKTRHHSSDVLIDARVLFQSRYNDPASGDAFRWLLAYVPSLNTYENHQLNNPCSEVTLGGQTYELQDLKIVKTPLPCLQPDSSCLTRLLNPFVELEVLFPQTMISLLHDSVLSPQQPYHVWIATPRWEFLVLWHNEDWKKIVMEELNFCLFNVTGRVHQGWKILVMLLSFSDVQKMNFTILTSFIL